MAVSDVVVEKLGKVNEVILNPLIILGFSVAVLYFFVGVFKFVSSAETDEGRETGKRSMIYGIIGIFIMVSVYGIIQLLLRTFSIDPPGSYLF